MSPKTRFAFALGMALLLSGRSVATDYYVRTSGSDGNPGTSAAAAWQTVQHALDTMVPGDTTYVGAGTYVEAVRSVRNGTAGAPIGLIADTTGASTGDAGTVALTRAGQDVVRVTHAHHLLRGFSISGGRDGLETVNADGLVLDRVVATSNGDDGFDLHNTDATLTDCTIDRALATGLEVTGSGNISLSGANVISNSGVYGVFSQDVTLKMAGGTVSGNRRGGIRCRRGSLSVDAATVKDNRRDGIRCDRATVTVSDSTFSNNRTLGIRAERSGSLTVLGTSISSSGSHGIYAKAVPVDVRSTQITKSRQNGIVVLNAPKGSVRDVKISSSGARGILARSSKLDLVSVAITASARDGILATRGGSLGIFDSTIEKSNNDGIEVNKVELKVVSSLISGSRGRGVFVRGAKGGLYSTQVLDGRSHGVDLLGAKNFALVNSVVARNGRHGIYARRGAKANIWHTVVADSKVAGVLVAGGTTFLTNSIVARNRLGLYLTGKKSKLKHGYNVLWKNRRDFLGTAAGTGELLADPAFTSSTDFHLLAASPAIDAGTDASATTVVDLEGNARPEGAAYDMGPYELAMLPAVDHFTVSHDGHGVYCLGETIRVSAIDSLGAVVDDYTGAITLDTQTGNGTWEATAANLGGFGDATPDDGIATYAFADADDGVAEFTLTYLQGGTPVDVDTFETANTALRDDDAEGTIVWSPSGFVVTANALSNPPPAVINDPIPTQTAGSVFPLHITAYGQTPTDPTCGVIESYTGARPVSFWGSHLDPGTGTLLPTIDAATIGSSQAAASAQKVIFSSGHAIVSAKYKDVGRIQIDLADLTVTEPSGGIPGATGDFVVRPAELEIAAIRRPDATSNPAVSVPTGAVFVAAGTPFEVDVRVLDAEGSLTPNFGQEVSPEGLTIRASTLVAPASGRNGTSGAGTILNGSSFSAVTPTGTFRGSSFGWDEVGAIRLEASVTDGSYLGTGPFVGGESGTVGRFTPASFDVALNAPSFESACTPGAFTYVGQEVAFAAGLEPEVTVTALNAQGTTTENYTGTWFRLDAASQTGLAFLAASGALTAAGPNPPTVSPLGSGRGRVRFDNGPDVGFQRTAPVAPFDGEIELRFDLFDQDGVAPTSANPVRFGQAAAGLGISFSAGKAQRFGRMVITNAHGSELTTLGVPLGSEFWNGSAFVDHTADVCTTAATAWLGLTPQPGSLSTSPTIGNNPLIAGDAGLVLSPPGVGQTGHVDLLFDLTTGTGADLPWLFGDWNGDGGWLESPTGRATFGIFAGEGRTIYVRDAY
ncbi:MAG: right-handed parallel beta-helix repeat-containing protein [bacterium]|nr:right-handed parallel beta-helix repeat-containing protein [bacterium]